MSTTDRISRIGKRYWELRDQGLNYKEAAKAVKQEFGSDIADSSIRAYASQYKKRLESMPPTLEGKERKERKPAVRHDSSQAEEPLPPLQTSDLDERIRAVAREVFQEMIDERDLSVLTDDVPPEPETIKGRGPGRVENRDYVKVSITVDKVLWKRFVAERVRMRVSSGRLMDILLWRAFGRPRLSYQEPDESDSNA